MSGDPGAVSAALQAALDAFEHGGTPEEGMSEREQEDAQLRKACRLIDAARTLQDFDGCHRIGNGSAANGWLKIVKS